MSLRSTFIRISTTIGDTFRDHGVDDPVGVLGECDIAYGPYADNLLDVYAPERVAGDLPLLVSVHGGSWVYGDKDRYRPYCTRLTEWGFVVVNFTYRLAPEHKWPAQLEDVCAALSWALEHAEEYGADSNRLVAVGDSAGAQLLALYCCCCTNPELAATHGVTPPVGGLPLAVGLNCGCYTHEGKGVLESLKRDVFVGCGTEEELEAFSPLNHVDESFPPAQLVTATHDFLRKDSEAMDARLTELGVPHELVVQASEDGKPLMHVFHLDTRSPLAWQANGEQCAYLLEHCQDLTYSA